MNNLAFFYDFETTGMVDWGMPSESEHQPHAVQVAAKLIDTDTKKCAAALNVIVQQGDWPMDPKALETHGIDREYANSVGFEESVVSRWMLDLWRRSSIRIAHDESFDARMMRIGLKRYADTEEYSYSDEWASGSAFCTMRATTDICCIPSPRGKGFKWPKLEEAYQHFFGKKLEGAHDAMVDVDACIEIYFAIKDQNLQK